MTHTPGPWTVEDYGDDDAPILVIHRDTDNSVCFMAMPGSHDDRAEIEANARLIAAAPNLLAALKATVDELEDADPRRRSTIEYAREIIAKATGESVDA